MIFSFAAPLGAIITFAIISIFGGSSLGKTRGIDGLQWWTGIALLFSVSPVAALLCGLMTVVPRTRCEIRRGRYQRPQSSDAGEGYRCRDIQWCIHRPYADVQGGSFLYVATVIQPLSSTSPEEHSHSDSHDDTQLGKYSRIGLLMGGMLLPVVLSWLVGHSH